VVVIIGMLIAACGPSAFAAAEKKDAKKDAKKEVKQDANQEKMAVVNGTVITKALFEKEMGRYEQQISMSGQAPGPGEATDAKDKVLKGLVDRELLIQQSKKLGIVMSDAELNDQIAGLKKRFSTEEQFTDALKQMNLTEAQLKEELRQDMAIKKMIDQEVGSKVTVTDQEAKAFYDAHPDYFKTPEMVRASHILIKVDPKATDADKAKAREKIAAIQKKVQEGGDFAALAKESSECPSSANGGDLNYFQRGQMVGPFEEAAFSLKPGTVSAIVETQFGYHLIKVTDKKEPGVTPYEEIKDRIEKHLKQQKVNEQVAMYVDQLRSTAKIETFAK
jgi:peptidyl-prolyl cis-trans isomerase C